MMMMKMKENNTYECWNRWRHLLQRKSLSGKPTSPHMQQTVWWSTILMVCCTDRESQSCDDRKGNFEGESERWLRRKKCDQWGKREETNQTPKKERERVRKRVYTLYREKKVRYLSRRKFSFLINLYNHETSSIFHIKLRVKKKKNACKKLLLAQGMP